jgi:hypothetical protein
MSEAATLGLERRFAVSGLSGVVTGLAAGAVVGAFRNPLAGTVQRLISARVHSRTLTGPTATSHELALSIHAVTAFGAPQANYTGGTALETAIRSIDRPFNAGVVGAYSSVMQGSAGSVRIADNAALAHAGAPTIDAQPLDWDAFFELSGASQQRGGVDIVYEPDRLEWGHNGGIVVRAPIAMQAGTTFRFLLSLVWSERGAVA